jgi:hypothetical protein
MHHITNQNFLYFSPPLILDTNRNAIEDKIMTTATFHTTSTLRSHLHDGVKALRSFAKALFAAQERQFVAQEIMAKPPRASSRSRVRNHMKLIAMANQYQDMQPSLAAELRQLASRG